VSNFADVTSNNGHRNDKQRDEEKTSLRLKNDESVAKNMTKIKCRQESDFKRDGPLQL